jgi:hypothetical protein
MLNYTNCWNIRIDGSYYRQLAREADGRQESNTAMCLRTLYPDQWYRGQARGRLAASIQRAAAAVTAKAGAGAPKAALYTDADAAYDQNVYEYGMVFWLEFLRRTWTGWALLKDVWRCSPKEIIIQPWLPVAEVKAVKDKIDRAMAPLLGEPVPPPGDPNDPGWLCLEENASAGEADMERLPLVKARVNFSPEFSSPPGMVYSKPGPGCEADESLLHEMTHAVRILRGVFDNSINQNPPDNPGWKNDEEFFAIVLTNIYRSELSTLGWLRPRRHGLRKDHKGHAALSPQLEDPKAFLGFGLNPGRFKRWAVEQPDLFQNLRQVRCPFNPIRAFFGDPVP